MASCLSGGGGLAKLNDKRGVDFGHFGVYCIICSRSGPRRWQPESQCCTYIHFHYD